MGIRTGITRLEWKGMGAVQCKCIPAHVYGLRLHIAG